MAEVQKSAFSLMSATLMIGTAFTDDVFGLTPALNSVGMVTNVDIQMQSTVTELLNGVQQVPVDSMRTGMNTSLTANVFEMTAQNIMRAQSLSGAPVQIRRGVLTAPLAGSAVSLSINSDPLPDDAASSITNLSQIPSGATLLIQKATGENDYVFPTRSSGATTGTGPFVVPIAAPYAIPAGMAFATGDHVFVLSEVSAGDIDADALYCVKITGTLTNYDRPVTYVAPKVRMVKGFGLSFNETQYTSMPWEMKPLLLANSELASLTRGADIGTRRTGVVYIGA